MHHLPWSHYNLYIPVLFAVYSVFCCFFKQNLKYVCGRIVSVFGLLISKQRKWGWIALSCNCISIEMGLVALHKGPSLGKGGHTLSFNTLEQRGGCMWVAEARVLYIKCHWSCACTKTITYLGAYLLEQFVCDLLWKQSPTPTDRANAGIAVLRFLIDLQFRSWKSFWHDDRVEESSCVLASVYHTVVLSLHLSGECVTREFKAACILKTLHTSNYTV